MSIAEIHVDPAVEQDRDKQQQELLDWLTTEFSKQTAPTTVHRDYARQEDNYLHVPVYIGGNKDAVQKAGIMQKIEDQWNYKRKPSPALRLLIVPSRN